MQANYLFVYGTLRRAYKHSLLKALNEYAIFISEATFQGILFLVDNYPGAIESNNLNDIVYGDIYFLKDTKKVLTILDEYEECTAAHNSPTEYIRCARLIKLNYKSSIKAWIYLYNHSTDDLIRIKNGDYLTTLVYPR